MSFFEIFKDFQIASWRYIFRHILKQWVSYERKEPKLQKNANLKSTRLKSNSVLDRGSTILFFQDLIRLHKTFSKLSSLSRFSRLFLDVQDIQIFQDLSEFQDFGHAKILSKPVVYHAKNLVKTRRISSC